MKDPQIKSFSLRRGQFSGIFHRRPHRKLAFYLEVHNQRNIPRKTWERIVADNLLRYVFNAKRFNKGILWIVSWWVHGRHLNRVVALGLHKKIDATYPVYKLNCKTTQRSWLPLRTRLSISGQKNWQKIPQDRLSALEFQNRNIFVWNFNELFM